MRAYIYFTITAILWGLNFHLGKILLQDIKFIEVGFWRYLLGVVPLFFLAYKELPPWSIFLKNLKGIILVGVFCLFGFNVFFFLGITTSPAINGALIVSVAPALTLLFSNLILKTPLKRKEIIGVFISFIGAFYLIIKGDFGNFLNIQFSWGDIYLLTAATFFSLQNVWVKKYGGNMTNKSFTFYTNLFCLVGFIVVIPFVGMNNVIEHSLSFWFAAFGIGCLGTALAYYLWNAGIRLTNANLAGVFINVIPLSTATFSVILGEPIYRYHLISGFIVVIGVLIIVSKVDTIGKYFK